MPKTARSGFAPWRSKETGSVDAALPNQLPHFWDPRAGAPSFVTDPVGDEVQRDPKRLDDFKRYVRNLATWLGG